jgi:hypothetical protein
MESGLRRPRRIAIPRRPSRLGVFDLDFGNGRVAQRESTPLTWEGSQVQSLSCPPFIASINNDMAYWPYRRIFSVRNLNDEPLGNGDRVVGMTIFDIAIPAAMITFSALFGYVTKYVQRVHPGTWARIGPPDYWSTPRSPDKSERIKKSLVFMFFSREHRALNDAKLTRLIMLGRALGVAVIILCASQSFLLHRG